MTTLTSNWETLRRKTRSIEATLDSKLTNYSALPTTILQSSSSSYTAINIDDSKADELEQAHQLENQSKDLEGEIEQLVEQVSKMVPALRVE